MFIFFCVGYAPLTYMEYVYPGWANGVGWILVIAAMALIPGYGIYYIAGYTYGDVRLVR